MSDVVVDASVAAKWLIPEDDSQAAFRMLVRQERGELRLHVPDLVYAEIANLLRRKCLGGELSVAFAERACEYLTELNLQVHPLSGLFGPATAIACKTRSSAYDCIYLVLAEQLGGRLLTADERFRRAMENTLWKRRFVDLESV